MPTTTNALHSAARWSYLAFIGSALALIGGYHRYEWVTDFPTFAKVIFAMCSFFIVTTIALAIAREVLQKINK